MTRTAAVLVAFLLAVAATARAQSPFTPLVRTGDVVLDGAVATAIGDVHMNDLGWWVVEVSTDDPHRPLVVLKAGDPWKAVGAPVAGSPGTTLGAIDSTSTELFGGVAYVARLDGTPGGAADDEAVFYEGSEWLREGPVLSWPTTQLPHGTRWRSFADVRCSGNRGGVLVRGRLDDPEIAGTDESFISVGGLCGSIGVLCGVTRLVSAGQLAPNVGARVQEVRLEPWAAAISPGSYFVVWSADLHGPESGDGVVYRSKGYPFTHAVVAREGTPSPVAGRAWGPLDDVAVDCNSAGQWTLRATLDGKDPADDALLVKSGQVFAREGDSPAAVAPDVLTGFGRGPARLDDQGRTVWYAQLDGPGGPSQALFVDDQLLARTGVTQVAGRTLVRLGDGPDDVSLTPISGQLLFTGTLAGGVEAAILVDLDDLGL